MIAVAQIMCYACLNPTSRWALGNQTVSNDLAVARHNSVANWKAELSKMRSGRSGGVQGDQVFKRVRDW